MLAWLLAVALLVTACGPGPVWNLDEPIYISTAWNLPQPDDYVAGLRSAIESLGGSVEKGAGPSASAFAPPGAQELHIFDASQGSGRCDVGDRILAFADSAGIHVCHNPAVFNWAFQPRAVSVLVVKRTMLHEFAHLGGLNWHWDCAALPENRIMGSTRACQQVDAYTDWDIDYACRGGRIQGGHCTGWTPFSDDQVARVDE